MGLDIRIPIGLMFAMLGVVLVLSGVIIDGSVYQKSLGINVNLWWGLVMTVFGGAMFIFGLRGGATARPAEESAEGRKIEAIEHQRGLESEPETNE